AVTVVWWTQHAASREMVQLLDQPLTSDQVGPIRNQLSRSGIDYEMQGETIMVPVASRDEAMAMLSYEKALPADTTRHFANAVSNIGSFDPAKKIDAAMRAATEQDLAQTIRMWPEVRSAKVHINGKYRRQVGGNMMPSAVVNIDTHGGSETRKIADAAAHTVASAVSALRPNNVTVIVDGRRAQTDSDNSALAGGNKLLELRSQAERHHEDNVRQAMGYIPGLHIAVSVEVNDAVTRETASEIDPDQKIIAPLSETTDIMDSLNGSTPGGQAGFVPNSALSVNGNGGDTSKKTSETANVNNVVDYNRKKTESYRQAGKTTPTSCTISVPDSYILAEWRSENRTTDDPTPEALAVFETQLLARFKEAARGSLNNLAADAIMVMGYADMPFGTDVATGGGALAAAGVAGTVEAGGMGSLVKDYGKTAAVLALAGVALFLMSTMVKKSAVTSAPVAPSFDTGLSGFEFSGNEVEVDEEVLAGGRTVEQVQALVKENPDAAAALVKRWIHDAA
ncbi:MAG: hypothetical protein AAGK78_04745, partial [Planctomycetota bacterium]